MNRTDSADARSLPPGSPRRLPVQRRSKERVERMLSAAAALIEEAGSDRMTLSDVAKRAGVPIGSLYQFFPDKTAVVRALAERSHEQSRKCIREALAPVRNVKEFRSAFCDLYDVYHGIFLAQPVMRDVWSAMQADKSLAAIELAESRANGDVVAEVLSRLRPKESPARLRTSSFLVMALGEATLRLAVSVERAEGEMLIEAYKRMALKELLEPEDRPAPG